MLPCSVFNVRHEQYAPFITPEAAEVWANFEQRIINRAIHEWQNNCGPLLALEDCTSNASKF